jgi:MATE family multidrug resistance protein
MSLALSSTRSSGSLLAEPVAHLRLAIPLILISLVNMGMSITDTLMVSASFGAEALAAVAVGSDFQSILFYLGAGTISGIAPLYTAAAGRLDLAEQAKLERAGQALVLLLGLALGPALWTAPDWLPLLGLDRELLEAGRGYTRAMALTLVPLLGVTLYRNILTAAQRPRIFLAVTTAMLPLNALGNHLLMNGFGPVQAFGPTGAGLSSLIVATATLLVLFLIARRTEGSTERHRINWTDIWPLLRIGLPIGVATVAELGIFLGATLYAATLGPAEVAAHTVALRVAGVAYAIPAALLQASTVRMALAETATDPALCRQVMWSALGLGALSGTCLLFALVLAADPIAQLILDHSTTGAAAAVIAAGLLLILGMMELIGNPGSAATGLLRGRKDTRVPMMITLFGYWVIAAPLGLWLSEGMGYGITGLWLGLVAGTAVTSALTLTRTLRPGTQ